MAQKCKKMSIIRQVLTGRKIGKSTREMARMYSMSRSTVQRYVRMAENDPLGIDGLLRLEDPELNRRFNHGTPAFRDNRYEDFLERVPYLRQQYESDRHMTTRLLWERYIEDVPDGYGLTQFRLHLNRFIKERKTTAILKTGRRPAEDMFMDFAGDRMEYVDRRTGKRVKVETFVAVLAYSGYAFVRFVPSQKIGDYISAVEAAIRFFGGAPKTLVPDNLKAAVKKVGRVPELTDDLSNLASHYGCCADPTRPGRPRDKALVENTVRNVYTLIYPELRGRTYHSVDEMNDALKGPLNKFNSRPMQGCGRSRLDLFMTEEKAALRPLPDKPFDRGRHKLLTVLDDGTILVCPERHRYSVPYYLAHEKVEVIITSTLVTVYHHGECVATHVYSSEKDGCSLSDEHLAPNIQAYNRYSPEHFINRASEYCEAAEHVMRGLFSTGEPKHNFGSANAILRLADKTDPKVFRMACEVAAEFDKYDYTFIESLVRSKCGGYLAAKGQAADPASVSPSAHVNIRGPQAFQ